VKRNTIVLGIVLLLLAIMGWAGWANWEYRKQAAEKRLATTTQKAELVADSSGAASYVSPLVDKPAPAFLLPDLAGKKVSLTDYKGKAVLINFWATWCGPCKLETPWIVELRNQYAAQGFEVLGIDTEGDDLAAGDKEGWTRTKTEVTKFIAEEHMNYPVLLDGDSLSKPYGGLDAMPTSFYVDRTGKVIAAQMGITSKSEMESNILKSLGAGK
jgi:thiol-disulfide isomerase/thioredoxin